jgi:hypothetical protein
MDTEFFVTLIGKTETELEYDNQREYYRYLNEVRDEKSTAAWTWQKNEYK